MQLMRKSMSTTLAATLLVAVSVGACKGKDQYAAGETAAADSTAAKLDSTGAPAAAMATPPMAPAVSGWTSPTVLGFAHVADASEIALGKLAQTKATSPAVKAFAKQMVTDHQAMLKDGESLAKKLTAVPDTAADNARSLSDHARDEMKDLSDKASGAEWDSDYIDKAIDDHQKVLDKLQDAAKNTTDPDVRAAIEKATGKVQQHLTKAQDIKAKMKA
jgi:putative membrane protein